MACRDLAKAERAKAEIILETANENVLVRHLDLASMKSIHAFAKDINACKNQLICLYLFSNLLLLNSCFILDVSCKLLLMIFSSCYVR